MRRRTGRTVNYEDHASLKVFHCPDGSHLDFRDAIQFTRSFEAILDSLAHVSFDARMDRSAGEASLRFDDK